MSLSPIAVLHSTERVPPAKIRRPNNDIKATVQSTNAREHSGDLYSGSLSQDIIKMFLFIHKMTLCVKCLAVLFKTFKS